MVTIRNGKPYDDHGNEIKAPPGHLVTASFDENGKAAIHFQKLPTEKELDQWEEDMKNGKGLEMIEKMYQEMTVGLEKAKARQTKDPGVKK
ncbi:hypothetical protein CAEBREN_25831 [Caenorhabditis brenneri]|uniref:Uncharacterized protein n=1 Tax=Caenorhabditis brenneri TaxID=135651 RepID=G0N2Y8_CAEBE|nr:hypothetical protein CAEBREN_25831 [Caenorhabditis brenneri]